MGRQAEAGEGQVGRRDLAAHLEVAAVVGLPGEAELGHHVEQGAVLDGPARELADAVAANVGEPPALDGGVAAQRRDVGAGQALGQRGVPGLAVRVEPAAAGGRFAIVGVLPEPGALEGELTRLRGHGHDQASRLHPCLGQPQGGGDIGEADQALAVVGGAGGGVLGVVAQPDAMEAASLALLEGQQDGLAVVDQVGGLEHGALHDTVRWMDAWPFDVADGITTINGFWGER